MAVATRGLSIWLTDRDAPADGADPRLRQRLRLIVASLLLAVLAFATRPGNIIADTKIDMPLNPVRFLSRALRLWDLEQFGQLQNQVSGYFFPMGPFYAAGRAIGLSPWVVQRLWLTAVMVAAFIGVVKLAGKLGIGSPAASSSAGWRMRSHRATSARSGSCRRRRCPRRCCRGSSCRSSRRCAAAGGCAR